MPASKVDPPQGFTEPTAVPTSEQEFRSWQEANRAWWEKNPMRYDWTEKIKPDEFSAEFFNEIDHRFFSAAWEFMGWQRFPFDQFIDFDSLASKDVLEIGVGSGSHAQLLAARALSFCGIDITDRAIAGTSARLRLAGLQVPILRMEAEELNFPNDHFDFVWSWGVIHHCSDPRRVLSEIKRVLKPGGTAITMVYHRNFWNYYLFGGLFRGIFQGNLIRTGSIHKTVQLSTDGAIARYYSIPEWRALTSEHFTVDRIQIYGSKSEILPLPSGKLKERAMSFIPNSLSRFLTNRCRLGTFLVSVLKKGG